MILTIGFTLLAVPTVWLDLRARKIPVWFCIAFTVAAVTLNLVFKWISIWEVLFGLVFGGAFLLFSVVSREALGMGDGWLILAGSVWCGVFAAMEITLISLLLAGLCGAVYMIVKKKGWKTRLPFAPFYGVTAVGWSILTWILEGR